MQLSYRGIAHEKQPLAMEFYEREVAGKYGGCDWHYHYPRHIAQVQATTYKKYRGVPYNSPTMAKTAMPKDCPIDFRRPSKVFTDETQKIHLENLRRNLERRLQVAKANNNLHLVNLLEKEFNQLALID